MPSVFPTSFWYVKSPKTGSSTLGGVLRACAAHHGISMVSPGVSEHVMDPATLKLAAWRASRATDAEFVGLANHLPYTKAAHDSLPVLVKNKLLLFTSVREPVSHFHSVYVQKCFDGEQTEAPTACFEADVEGRMAAAQHMKPNPQFEYVKGGAADAAAAVAQYDFVFVRERLAESLMAFMVLYGLEFADVVHLSSKVRAGKYPSTEEMPATLNDLVRDKSPADADLFREANKLLDQKLAAIQAHCGGKDGERYVEGLLAAFERLQAAVAEECGEYKEWYEAHGFDPPYSYWGDNGMAPRCVDHVVRREWGRGEAVERRR